MSAQINRIVKMTFKQESIEDFLFHFDTIKEKIRAYPGCNALKLLRSVDQNNVFFTYSIWNGLSDLESYRQSELFKETWTFVKQLFDARAEEWSTEIIAEL